VFSLEGEPSKPTGNTTSNNEIEMSSISVQQIAAQLTAAATATTIAPSADVGQSGGERRETKRYKVKSKTEFLSTKNNENEQQGEANNENKRASRPGNASDNDNDNCCVGLSIQERLAALKKSGDEEWKKRSIKANDEIEASRQQQQQQQQQQVSPTSGLVKQQQQQLRQQLQAAASSQQGSKLKMATDVRRAILAPLNDNTNLDEELKINLNKLSQSNESLDSVDMIAMNMSQTQAPSASREKKTPVSKRVGFNSSEFSANLG
jgi:hypothetical protein